MSRGSEEHRALVIEVFSKLRGNIVLEKDENVNEISKRQNAMNGQTSEYVREMKMIGMYYRCKYS